MLGVKVSKNIDQLFLVAIILKQRSDNLAQDVLVLKGIRLHQALDSTLSGLLSELLEL